MDELEIILEYEDDIEQIIDVLEEEIVKVFPELEDLEVTPSAAEQKFKSEKYGYDNVTVKAVETDELHIIPSIETQVEEGLFSKVTVEAIEDLTDEITEQDEIITNQDSTIENIIKVLTQKSGVNNKLQEKSVMPSTETQEIIPDEEYFGLSKVTVPGDEDLLPENIKKGTSIFGVEGNASVANFKITSGYYLFYSGNRTDYLQEILSMCDKITSAYYMFNGCYSLTELDVSNLDTSEATSMGYMFYDCENLTELDLSNFDTSKVTNMQYIFSGCGKLTKLDVSSFNTSNVTTMYRAFYGLHVLTELDLSSFDMGKVINVTGMFSSNSSNSSYKSFKSFYNLGKGYTQKTNNYSNYKIELSRPLQKSPYEEIMLAINNLYDLNLSYDVANGGTLYTQDAYFGSYVLKKLTPEDIAIATNKRLDCKLGRR